MAEATSLRLKSRTELATVHRDACETGQDTDTSDETVTIAYELIAGIGSRPAVVQKEAPGFIGNRLQAALMRECLSIVDRGMASAEDIDTVVKNGYGIIIRATPFG